MNYLITGATGFVGRHLVAALLSSGYGVNYLGRKRDLSMDSRAAFLQWDGTSQPPLDCMGRLDGVIQLAGEPVAQRWNAEVKRRIRDSRVLGTQALVAAIGQLKHKPPALVSASAIGYYGERGDETLTEESAPGSDFLSEVCIAWEREAERAKTYGVRVVTPRISIVLGKEAGALPKMAAPFRMGFGGTLGNGQQWMSWIQVEDLAALLLFAVQNEDLSGPVNAASPEPVTNREFTRVLSNQLHRPALFRIPKAALRLVMGEAAVHATASTRVLPEVAQQHGFTFRYPDLAGALAASL